MPDALQRADEAFAAFERALALNGELAAAWLGRGVSFADGGQHDEAIADFTRALALQPDMPLALFSRGVVAMENGRFAEARADLQRAVDIAPEDDEIAIALADVQMRQGDWAEASYITSGVLIRAAPPSCRCAISPGTASLPGITAWCSWRSRVSATPWNSRATPHCWQVAVTT